MRHIKLTNTKLTDCVVLAPTHDTLLKVSQECAHTGLKFTNAFSYTVKNNNNQKTEELNSLFNVVPSNNYDNESFMRRRRGSKLEALRHK